MQNIAKSSATFLTIPNFWRNNKWKKYYIKENQKNKDDYAIIKKAFPDKCKNEFVYGCPIYDEHTNRWFICISGVYKMNCCISNASITVIEVMPETIVLE